MDGRPVFLVFGHSDLAGDGSRVTPVAAARVQAVAAHLAEASGDRPLVVFTGGRPTHAGSAGSEGELMLRVAVELGLDAYADLVAETRSRSTLDNLLCVVEDGLLGNLAFSPARPLGLVSHDWHLPRIRLLARRVLRLPAAALLDVPASGPRGTRPRWSERTLRLGSSLLLTGSRDPAVLRRRELAAVASARLLRRHHGEPR